MTALKPGTSMGVGLQMPLSPPMLPEEERLEHFLIFADVLDNNYNSNCLLTNNDDDNKHIYHHDDTNQSMAINTETSNAFDPSFCLNINTSQCHHDSNHDANLVSVYTRNFNGDNKTVSVPTYQSSTIDTMPELGRQTSLSIVMEVLGTCQNPESQNVHSHVIEDRYPPTPSPSITGDEVYLSHPSLLHSQNGTMPCDTPARSRTFSDPASFFVSTLGIPNMNDSSRTRASSADFDETRTPSQMFSNFSFDLQTLVETGFGLMENKDEDSPAVTNSEDYNDSIDQCVTSTVERICGDATTSPVLESPSLFAQTTSENAPPLALLDEGSLDVIGMMDDFIASTNHLEQATTEYVKMSLSHENNIRTDHAYAAEEDSNIDKKAALSTAESDSSSRKECSTVIDLTGETAAAPCEMGRSLSYTRKRNRNNVACRESRKKRKVHRDEMDEKLKFLEEDNNLMKSKIAELEIEVKATRERLIAQMTGAPLKR